MRDLYLFRSILTSKTASCNLDRLRVLDQGTHIDLSDLGPLTILAPFPSLI
jgi:hypothetical protein